MHISQAADSRGAARSVRQHEWDEDQARWEAKLRQLALPRPSGGKPLDPPVRPRRRTSLELVGKLTSRDALLLPRSLPSFSGDEREDCMCGKCGGVIASRTSPGTIRGRHPEGERLVIRCVCGALNLLFRDGGSA